MDKIDLNAVPYMINSRTLDFGFSQEKVFVAMCLVDHLVMGVGCSRDEAMKMMLRELDDKYGDKPDAFKTE